MLKNDVLTGAVFALGVNGEGLVKVEDKIVFVPFALQNEKIQFKILKISSKGIFGKLLNILESSDKRVVPLCPVFTKCGGCQLQHLEYLEQLNFKKNKIINCFKKISFLDVKVNEIVCGKNNFYYRNKLQLPVGEFKNQLVIGFYADNSHRIVNISNCCINKEWISNIILALKEYMTKYNLLGYDENNFSGDIREITVREINQNLLITIVCLKNNLPKKDDLINIFKKYITYNFSLYLNINNNKNNLIYSENFNLIYGQNEYFSEMLGIKYKTNVKSFSQVNDDVCLKLYSKVKLLANININTVVIDAYSGAGLLTAILALNAKKAIGIEIIKEAVQVADELKKINNLSNKIENICSPCENVLPSIVAKESKNSSEVVLILDPPRKGCELNIIEAIKKSNLKKVIYISCNPATLARDIGLLTGSLIYFNNQLKKSEKIDLDFSIDEIVAFDMFPQTKHVETLVTLTRKI